MQTAKKVSNQKDFKTVAKGRKPVEGSKADAYRQVLIKNRSEFLTMREIHTEAGFAMPQYEVEIFEGKLGIECSRRVLVGGDSINTTAIYGLQVDENALDVKIINGLKAYRLKAKIKAVLLEN